MANKKNSYKTEQENFWSGEFGTKYIERNKSDNLLAANLTFFSNIFRSTGKIFSCIEFGANIGMNLRALQLLYPKIKLKGIEINPDAANGLKKLIGEENVLLGSILDYKSEQTFDVSLIKGVLIHTNPDELEIVYQKLYDSSHLYILLCEYYNPSPVTISYRGYKNKLFKRDFAGELLDLYSDLNLVDYGFSYHRDKAFPHDDITWFLLEKGK